MMFITCAIDCVQAMFFIQHVPANKYRNKEIKYRNKVKTKCKFWYIFDKFEQVNANCFVILNEVCFYF